MTPPVKYHKTLAEGRWFTFSLAEQLGNIGSEVERAITAREKGDETRCEQALERMLELMDLTLADPRWRDHPLHRLRELARLREVLCDAFYGKNEYRTTFQSLKNYFLPFALLARRNRPYR